MLTLTDVLTSVYDSRRTSVTVFWDGKKREFSHEMWNVGIVNDHRQMEEQCRRKFGSGTLMHFEIDGVENGLQVFQDMYEHFMQEPADMSVPLNDIQRLDPNRQAFLCIYMQNKYK
jgi:hypothetical protein